MDPLSDTPLAIVDLETTGAHPAHDRITEIAVLEAERGEITREWSTLVNPRIAIPPAIEALTGITAAMVADAPTFGELAAALHARLQGRLFVAHNARFDYGFLQHAFERANLRFHARTLCTVKLSRRLYPGESRHNLDSVIARHGLRCDARHRALGDARVVWSFLQAAERERGAAMLGAAARQLARQHALPAQIDRATIDAIPEAPGVYLFYGDGGAPLYVGKSTRLRTRVLQHFAHDPRSSRKMQLARELRSIEWQRTAGELGASLRAAELVATLRPTHNRRRRNARLQACAWPYPGAIGIVERDAARDAHEVHVVQHWSWLGCARSESDVAELLAARGPLRFDPDHYRILARHLAKPRVRIVPLACTPN